MPTSDQLVERLNLKSRLKLWRLVSLVLFIIVIISVKNLDTERIGRIFDGGYIARLEISGMIKTDRERDLSLLKVVNDKNIEAVIININSQGGTFVGSELLYHYLMEISKKKPIVAVLSDLSASGGYMAALGADYIIAHHGTLTGSIGVIAQYVGVKGLADKLGISLKSIKSSQLKSMMSPFEDLSSTSEAAMQSVIKDSYNHFVDLVSLRRNLSRNDVLKIADGRIYTGSQAIKLKLIDQIGTEDDAIEWLAKKGIKSSKVKDVSLSRGVSSFVSIKNFFQLKNYNIGSNNTEILAIW